VISWFKRVLASKSNSHRYAADEELLTASQHYGMMHSISAMQEN
jgi:hypothetical protein